MYNFILNNQNKKLKNETTRKVAVLLSQIISMRKLGESLFFTQNFFQKYGVRKISEVKNYASKYGSFY